MQLLELCIEDEFCRLVTSGWWAYWLNMLCIEDEFCRLVTIAPNKCLKNWLCIEDEFCRLVTFGEHDLNKFSLSCVLKTNFVDW